MPQFIEHFLDRITMYRLVLYYVIGIILMALVLSVFGVLHYSPLSILGSSIVILGVGLTTNYVFSKVFAAPTNFESVYITAAILVCILPPLETVHDLPLLFFATALAMGSKFMFAIRNKHIFNPAAIAVVLTAFWLSQSATWWIGTAYMIPVVVIGGVLMVHKMRRWDMIYWFLFATFLTVIAFCYFDGRDLLTTTRHLLIDSPLFFFAFVMFTEPLTSPPTKDLQMWFGILVGVLFGYQVHKGSTITPEIALVLGNIFAYVVSPKMKERLTLVRSENIAPDVMEYSFKPSRRFAYQAGQYMEFTLPHPHIDARGNRRYFTVASSPTEEEVKLGVKFYPNGSSFKKKFLPLTANDDIMVGQLAGDFTLPKDASKKLVFIAGGIGVTPFRSMIKYLTDSNDTRPVTLMYMNKVVEEIVYRDIFDASTAKIVYILTDAQPEGWTGRSGIINDQMIREEVPDFNDRMFYISGPHGMVVGVEKTLRNMGVKSQNIKKDFFPGLT